MSFAAAECTAGPARLTAVPGVARLALQAGAGAAPAAGVALLPFVLVALGGAPPPLPLPIGAARLALAAATGVLGFPAAGVAMLPLVPVSLGAPQPLPIGAACLPNSVATGVARLRFPAAGVVRLLAAIGVAQLPLLPVVLGGAARPESGRAEGFARVRLREAWLDEQLRRSEAQSLAPDPVAHFELDGDAAERVHGGDLSVEPSSSERQKTRAASPTWTVTSSPNWRSTDRSTSDASPKELTDQREGWLLSLSSCPSSSSPSSSSTCGVLAKPLRICDASAFASDQGSRSDVYTAGGRIADARK
eukprot:CAMPEP_0204219754 /NCGR_PEP_ID=MMETSP0361-20130328/80511_1 /ASSEMBLY_ACC=CAM_ASM_000343 /TAXON_ID=268821 /ORGANISM="Scrippsiella Hangoei, Strain SHTV-5" /LENGTH=304 /DNA_ID=CAMNT_0051185067 /DNA_START=304 /DNA_END=1222 /DNA_ORIENTATION=+